MSNKHDKPKWTGMHQGYKKGKKFAGPGNPNDKALKKLKIRQAECEKARSTQHATSIIYHMPGSMKKIC